VQEIQVSKQASGMGLYPENYQGPGSAMLQGTKKAAAKVGFNDDLRDMPSNRPLSKNRGSQDQNKHFATS
jgi:hypothetical protein